MELKSDYEAPSRTSAIRSLQKRLSGSRHSTIPAKPRASPSRAASTGPTSVAQGPLSNRSQLPTSNLSDTSGTPTSSSVASEDLPIAPNASVLPNLGRRVQGGPSTYTIATRNPLRPKSNHRDPAPSDVTSETDAAERGSGKETRRQRASSSSSVLRVMRAGLRRARLWSGPRAPDDSCHVSNSELYEGALLIGEAAEEAGTPESIVAVEEPRSPKVSGTKIRLVGSPSADCGVPEETPLPTARGLGSVGMSQQLRHLSGESRARSCPPTSARRSATSTPVSPASRGAIGGKRVPRHADGRDKEQRSSKGIDIEDIVCVPVPELIADPTYRADVALSVYSLKGASAINKFTELAGLGGAYHVGIEIFSLEWSFGWTPQGTGVHNVYSGCSEAGVFKERVLLGHTPCTPQAVLGIIGALRDTWSGTSYDLLRRNCGHFSMELVRQLKVRDFPDWVNSLASLLLWLTEWVDTPDAKASQAPLRIPATGAVSADCAEAAVAYSELDWKEAQKYMLERAMDAKQARRRRLLAQGNSQERGVHAV